jgi:hypothetical protein
MVLMLGCMRSLHWLQCFLEGDFLRDARDSLRPGGSLIINVASRVEAIVQDAKAKIASVFDWAFSVPIGVSQCLLNSLRGLNAESQLDTLNELLIAGVNPPCGKDCVPLSVPVSPASLTACSAAMLASKLPKIGGAVSMLSRGSPSCSFASLPLDEFSSWLKSPRWIKAPTDAVVDTELPWSGVVAASSTAQRGRP